MNLTHIHAFTAAMTRKDLDAMLSHMAEDVVLHTPLTAAALAGKEAIRPVVTALLGVVERFDFREIMQGPEHVSSFFTVTAAGESVEAMDLWRLAPDGRIAEMRVFWRPLPTAKAIADRLSSSEPVQA